MLFLNVPYAEKDRAKALGARWDADSKKWYVPTGELVTPFEQWLGAGKLPESAATTGEASRLKTGEKEGLRPAKPATGRVDSAAGQPVTGANYIELDHDCNPFEVCEQCRPVLAASGWAAARDAAVAALAAL